jgi:hypothetical protein
LEHAAARPVIVPETIVSDRHKIFISQTFQDACARLGISLHPARAGEPTDKPSIERTFLSIRTLFAQYVAGYTGRDVAHRGAHVETDAVWTLPQLQELFDQWVVAGWQPRPHDGLRVPQLPRAALSPNEMYAALVATAGYLPLALTGTDYLELLPVTWRRITDTGIELDVLIYDDEALEPLRGQRSSFDDHSGRWPIHHDPYDRGQVWVRDQQGRWLEVPWVHRGMVRAPFAEFTVRHVRAQIAARAEDNSNQVAIAAALEELLDRAGAGPAEAHTQRVAARTRAATRPLPGSPSPLGQGASATAHTRSAAADNDRTGDDRSDDEPADVDLGREAERGEVADAAPTPVATAFAVFDPHAEAERLW